MRVLTVFLLASIPLSGGSQPAEPTVLGGVIPGTDAVVTVSEGPREPRSIGSYALRLYLPYDPAWPYDAFAFGLVRTRDGVIEALLFSDLDGDDAREVIVVIRSAGSGGYLLADAFALRGRRLDLVGHVDGLLGNADPVAALRRLMSGAARD